MLWIEHPYSEEEIKIFRQEQERQAEARRYYSIPTLAAKVGITANQLFDILLECSHVANDNGEYAVASSGAELGGIDLPDDIHDEYMMIFPARLLDDPSVREGVEKIKKQECLTYEI